MAPPRFALVEVDVERRVVAAVWSGLCLTVMLAAPPWALVALFGNPLPADPPEQPYVREWIAAMGVLLAWVVWLGLVALVCWQVRLAMRQVRLPHVRVAAAPEGLLPGLVGAVVVGAATVASRGGAGHVAVTPVPVVAAAQPVAASNDALIPADDHRPPAVVALDAVLHGPPSGPPPVETGDRDDPAGGEAGVDVPGGWVPTEVARMVTAAAMVVWVRRRRRYVPRPITVGGADDGDLAALPETVEAISAGWLDQAATGSLPTDEEFDRAGALAAATPIPNPVGHTAMGPLRPGDLPPGGVGLVGAAAGAARGILTAVLLTSRPHPPPGIRVVTTTQTIAGLLDPAPPYEPVPGLTICRDQDELLHVLETEILHRHRITTAHPAGNHAGPVVELAPLLVVAAVPPDRGAARRLAVALTASGLGIHGLLLGSWEYGSTWQVDLDGHVRTNPGHAAISPRESGVRLCVLPVSTARDLLTLPTLAQPAQASTADRMAPAIAGTRPAPSPAGWPAGRWPATPATAVLQVRLLGAVDVVASPGDTPVPVELERRRAALQILVFLAVHPDGATSADLAAALWPGHHPRPVARVYNPASALRTALRQATRRDVLTRDGEVYRLDSHGLDVDLWRLHAAIAAVRAATGPEQRARALRAVVDTYTGELAAGRPWPWIVPYRELVRRRVIDAYTDLAATATSDTAATLLTRAVQVDPYNDQLHHRAITAHARAGHHETVEALLARHAARLAALGEPSVQD